MALLCFFNIFTATVSLILLAICLWTLRRSTIPFNWPVVGMLPGLLMNAHHIQDFCTSVLKETGGTFLLKGPWFTGMDRLCTADPSDVHYIMSTNFPNFQKGPKFIKIFELAGDGIFTSDGELWKSQRKLAKLTMNHPSFTRFSIKTSEDKVWKGLIPILDDVAERGLVVDIQDVFKRFTFDTTCIIITGYDPLCLSPDMPGVPFSEAMDDAWGAFVLRHMLPECVWKIQNWLGIGAEGKLIKACATIDRIVAGYISMKKDEFNSGIFSKKEDEDVDLLASYLSNKDVTELKRDDKFLRDNVISFMLAGRDTVSSALTWFLWLVATHPNVEFKIQEELNASIPAKESKSRHHFKLEEVGQLVYLESAICESLRLYPPVPLQHKESIKQDILPSGYHVRPNMKVLFSVYAMGRMESVWGKDCLEFKPERWLSEQGMLKHEPSYKFLAFNTGPRSCLGKEMTFIQMKVIMASIIHNYNVEVLEGHNVEPNMSIILYVKHGLKVKVSKR